MHYVAQRDHALVRFESDALADVVREKRSAYQADTGASPYDSDPGGTALEHLLAKETEENLSRSAAGGPADAYQSESQNQRSRAHVAQAFGVFVPGPDHAAFRECPHAAVGPEPARVS